MSSSGAAYSSLAFGLELPARAIAPLHVPSAAASPSSTADRGDGHVHRFIVGTCGGGKGNKLQLLELAEDSHDTAVGHVHGAGGGTTAVECAAVWSHDDEIVRIDCSPSATEETLFSVVSRSCDSGAVDGRPASTVPRYVTTVYGLPSVTGDVVVRTTITSRQVRCVAWEPQGGRASLAAVCGGGETVEEDQRLVLFRLGVASGDTSAGEPVPELEVPLAPAAAAVSATGSDATVRSFSWDPHHSSSFIVAAGPALLRVDTRAKAAALASPPAAHSGAPVMSVEHTANHINTLVTAGADGAVRVWDLRKPNTALTATLPTSDDGHAHRVNCARLNPCHDQLVLSCSSDFTAKLWNAPSVITRTKASHSPDGVVRTLSDFTDSVMHGAWSAASPWVYATVSFNGKVVVDYVPHDLMMSILMGQDEE